MSEYNVICNGEYGGGDYTNLSSYTLEWGDKKILLDAGTIPNDGKYDLVFLSHSHIDHSKDFLLNLDRFKGIPVISDLTDQDFKDLKLNNQSKIISPPDPKKGGVVKNLPGFDDKWKFELFPLDHHEYCGPKEHTKPSFALSITYNKETVIYFGDCTTINEDKNKYFQNINNSLDNKDVKLVFIECAFPNGTPDNLLYGHMRPDLLASAFSKYDNIFTGADKIITHRKPDISIDNEKMLFSTKKSNKIFDELISIAKDNFTQDMLIPLKDKSLKNFINLKDYKKGQKSTPPAELKGTLSLVKDKDYVYKHQKHDDLKLKHLMQLVVLSPVTFGLKFGGTFVQYGVKTQDQFDLVQKIMNKKYWPNLMPLFTFDFIPGPNKKDVKPPFMMFKVNSKGGYKSRRYRKKKYRKSKKNRSVLSSKYFGVGGQCPQSYGYTSGFRKKSKKYRSVLPSKYFGVGGKLNKRSKIKK